MHELSKTGLVTQLFLPTLDKKKQDIIYTLSRSGARELARLKGMEVSGLAGANKPSFFFLEHQLLVSEYMVSLEAALITSKARLVSWKSERQLKSKSGRALRVPNPLVPGERIPVIPDGMFSLNITGRTEFYMLECDRGTMSMQAIRKKMLGYLQLYRRGFHRSCFKVPHFRTLLVTTTPYRRDRMRSILKGIKLIPNLFWFATWKEITPDKVLRRIWLKCNDDRLHSIIE
jgi:hypothetical protein